MRLLVWLLSATLFLATVPRAHAHDPGLSTATLRLTPANVEATLTFALADAENLRLAEENLAGSPFSQAQLGVLVASNFVINPAAPRFGPGQPTVQLDAKNNLLVQWTAARPAGSSLSGRSKLIGLLPRGHRQFLSVVDASGKPLLESLLSAERDVWSVNLGEPAPGLMAPLPRHSFGSFLWLGIEHILTGYDHLLFLFGLLVVVPSFRSAVQVVSCFTLAHSITLALATFGLIQIPSRVVEPLIAATIVYIGIENLILHEAPKGRWLLTLGFGLVHGFGFATALRERGVGSGDTGILVPLLSFNLGVELGQIVVAALVLPAIWALKARPRLMYRLVPVCSVVVALLGGYWFIARAMSSWR